MTAAQKVTLDTMVNATRTYFRNHGRDVRISIEKKIFAGAMHKVGILTMDRSMFPLNIDPSVASAKEVWLIETASINFNARICFMDAKGSNIVFTENSKTHALGVHIDGWTSVYNALERILPIESNVMRMITDLARRVEALEKASSTSSPPTP